MVEGNTGDDRPHVAKARSKMLNVLQKFNELEDIEEE